MLTKFDVILFKSFGLLLILSSIIGMYIHFNYYTINYPRILETFIIQLNIFLYRLSLAGFISSQAINTIAFTVYCIQFLIGFIMLFDLFKTAKSKIILIVLLLCVLSCFDIFGIFDIESTNRYCSYALPDGTVQDCSTKVIGRVFLMFFWMSFVYILLRITKKRNHLIQ